MVWNRSIFSYSSNLLKLIRLLCLTWFQNLFICALSTLSEKYRLLISSILLDNFCLLAVVKSTILVHIFINFLLSKLIYQTDNNRIIIGAQTNFRK